ncbi:DNA cytosine methyltransferase [Paenibacillus pseudetheri]|uniref:DNA (cytosine-5-)-methyltransferase n=1 Tax=Paenibacillus pseudetheri TaxID=2897682 RepID=A0ABM9BK84_9BACL|nr:DNA (cytosine-5-)-methyltransferase [Paenibacillus pseudetheri]CAH1059347.1 Modification methylase HaeIII [Paenibacillus pseudetheri]
MQPTVISLCCGAGGLDLGFERAGFEMIWGIDIDKDSCLSHNKNFLNEVVNGDVFHVDIDLIPKSDLIIASLPATTFSLSGGYSYKSIFADKGILQYKDRIFEIVQNNKPIAFLIEGHKTFLKEHMFNDYLARLNSINYQISYEILNTKDYGIAQNKERLIIVGIKKQLNVSFEFPLKHPENVTVKDVIKNLDHIDYENRKKIYFKTLERI